MMFTKTQLLNKNFIIDIYNKNFDFVVRFKENRSFKEKLKDGIAQWIEV